MIAVTHFAIPCSKRVAFVLTGCLSDISFIVNSGFPELQCIEIVMNYGFRKYYLVKNIPVVPISYRSYSATRQFSHWVMQFQRFNLFLPVLSGKLLTYAIIIRSIVKVTHSDNFSLRVYVE